LFHALKNDFVRAAKQRSCACTDAGIFLSATQKLFPRQPPNPERCGGFFRAALRGERVRQRQWRGAE
jgi:hypothetical protein